MLTLFLTTQLTQAPTMSRSFFVELGALRYFLLAEVESDGLHLHSNLFTVCMQHGPRVTNEQHKTVRTGHTYSKRPDQCNKNPL